MHAARQADGETRRQPQNANPRETDNFRRPVLLDATLLKCALLAVALPQAFKTPKSASEELVAKLRGDKPNPLQELLGRGGWHHLVSVAFRSRLQPAQWDQKLGETVHDWWLCASNTRACLPCSVAQRVGPGDVAPSKLTESMRSAEALVLKRAK